MIAIFAVCVCLSARAGKREIELTRRNTRQRRQDSNIPGAVEGKMLHIMPDGVRLITFTGSIADNDFAGSAIATEKPARAVQSWR